MEEIDTLIRQMNDALKRKNLKDIKKNCEAINSLGNRHIEQISTLLQKLRQGFKEKKIKEMTSSLP